MPIRIRYALGSLAVAALLFCIQTPPANAQQILPTSTARDVLTNGVIVDKPGANAGGITSGATVQRSQYGDYAHAMVRDIKQETGMGGNGSAQIYTYKLEILDGKNSGQLLPSKYGPGNDNVRPEVGEKIVVFLQPGADQNVPDVFMESYDRSNPTAWWVLAILLALLAISGIYGLRVSFSVIAVALTAIFVLAPLYLRGWPPVMCFLISSLLATGTISIATLGLAKKAILATAAAWLGSSVAYLAIDLAAGWAHAYPALNDASRTFFNDNPSLDVAALVKLASAFLASVLITDLACAVIDGVARLKQVNPMWSFKESFISGMALGRERLATLSPVLMAAACGTGFAVLIGRIQEDMAWTQFWNSNALANAIQPAFGGLLGLALALPIVSTVAALSWGHTTKKLDPMHRAQAWRPDFKPNDDQGTDGA